MPDAEPIRVLLVAPSMAILGGQAVQAALLLRNLKRDPSVAVDFQPIPPPFPRPFRFLENLPLLRTASRILAHTLCLLRRAHRYQILHVFSAGYTSYLFWTIPVLAVGKIYRRKVLLHYHDGQGEDHLRNWKTAIPTIRMMDEIVAPSGFLVDVFARFGFHVQTISNVVDRSKFRYRKRSRLRPLFLHNRILEPLYNVRCSLRAFQLVQQAYPDASLTIAHDGPSRTGLEEFARKLGLRNYRFIGKFPQDRIGELYDAADIYLTSPDFDCMPGSILECFASGLPVIATAVGGIPYIAEDGVTAILVPRDDHQAMADAALRLLSDPAYVERLTRRAYESLDRYAETPVREAWVRLYHSMAGRASA